MYLNTIKILIALNILGLYSCNIADQKPVEVQEQNIESGTQEISKDNYFFSKSQDIINEDDSTVTFNIQRESQNFSAKTIYVEVLGDMKFGEDWKDLIVNEEAANYRIINSNFVYAVKFKEGSKRSKVSFDLIDNDLFNEQKNIIFRIIDDKNASYLFNKQSSFKLLVNDNEDIPELSLNAQVNNINEGEEIQLVVQLSSPSANKVTANISVNTQLRPEEYSISNQGIIFEPGETTKTINLNSIDDDYNEDTETISLQLSNPSGAILSENRSQQITINDNEGLPTLSFIINTLTIAEISEPTNISLTLLGKVENDIFVSLENTGTASEFSDYRLSGKRIKFNKDVLNQSQDVTATILDDNIYEDNEFFKLKIKDEAFLNLGNNQEINITIQDNETPPSVQFLSSTSVAQEDFLHNVLLKLSHRSSNPIAVTIQLINGTATQGSDFIFSSPTVVTIPANTYNVAFPVQINRDEIFEGNELINFRIIAINNGIIDEANKNHSVTIIDEANVPKVTFSTSTQEATEGEIITVNVSIDRESSIDTPFSISINRLNTEEDDYSPFNLDHSIPAGQQNYSFSITLTDDNIDEPQESMQISIAPGAGHGLGQVVNQTIKINDNDIPPKVKIVKLNDPNSNESDLTEGESIEFQLILVDDNNNFTQSEFDIVVPVLIDESSTATSDDFSLAINNLTVPIPAGSSSANFTLETINDDIYEIEAEFITISINENEHNRVHTQNSFKINLIESLNEPSITTEELDNLFEGERINIPISISSVKTEDTVIPFTISNKNYLCNIAYDPTKRCASLNDINVISDHVSDGETITGSITISAGETTSYLVIQALNDEIYEPGPDEKLEISINDESKSFNIFDINDKPKILFNSNNLTISKNENSSNFSIPIKLSSPIEGKVTFLISSKELEDVENPVNAQDFTLLPNNSDGFELKNGNQFNNNNTSFNDIMTIELELDSLITQADILFRINEDQKYEENETVQIILAQSVNSEYDEVFQPDTTSNKNIYSVIIIDNENLPEVKLSLDNLANLTQKSFVEENLDADTPNTNLFSQISAHEIHNIYYKNSIIAEHKDISISIAFSGSATPTTDEAIIGSTFNSKIWHLYDYQLNHFNGYNSDSNTVSVTISKNSISSSFIPIKIHKDHRYEGNETIIAALTSVENATISNQNTVTLTINNDEPIPVVNYNEVTLKPNESQKFEETLFIVAVNDPLITKHYASERNLSFDISINAKLRDVASTDQLTIGKLSLNENNDFTVNISKGDERLNLLKDLRFYENLELNVKTCFQSLTEFCTLDKSKTYEYQFSDIVVKTSKNSSTSNGLNSSTFFGHTCSIFRGLVSCWGNNQFGQLGRGNTNNFGDSSSEDISDLSSTIDLGTDEITGHQLYAKKIALTRTSTCVLFSNNKVKCFGSNISGQLGLGISNGFDKIGDQSEEMGNNLSYLNLGEGTISDIYAMESGYCAQFDNNIIKCWGDNLHGQTGTESSNDAIGANINDMGANLQAVKIPNNENIDLFATGANHACVYTESNNLYCWGKNDQGQLGLNHTNSIGKVTGSMNDSQVDINLTITQLSLGKDHTCINSNNTHYNSQCFGSNIYGQLGVSRANKVGFATNPYINFDNYILQDDASSVGLTTNALDSIGATNEFLFTKEPLTATGIFPIDSNTQIRYDDISKDPLIFPYQSSNGYNSIALKKHNQRTGQYFPSTKLISGDTYTCGVYEERFNPDHTIQNTISELHMRCWGSNVIYSSLSFTNNSINTETAVLNNFGYNNTFNGCLEFQTNIEDCQNIAIPFNGSPYGTFTFPNNCSTSNASDDSCKFIDTLIAIGNKSDMDANLGKLPIPYFQAGNVNDDEIYDFGYFKGYNTSDGFPVDFEMNYEYGRVKIDFQTLIPNLTDLKVSGGGSHICVVPASNEIDNKVLCWGANQFGQTGYPTISGTAIGGRSNTTRRGSGFLNSSDLKVFNYTFTP